jgi:hypothetical protein
MKDNTKFLVISAAIIAISLAVALAGSMTR